MKACLKGPKKYCNHFSNYCHIFFGLYKLKSVNPLNFKMVGNSACFIAQVEWLCNSFKATEEILLETETEHRYSKVRILFQS